MSELLDLPTGDEQPCLKCGEKALDTGWECTACGYDNMPWYYRDSHKTAQVEPSDEQTR